MFIPYAARVAGSLIADKKVPLGARVLELGAQTYSVSAVAIEDIEHALRNASFQAQADALTPFETVTPAHKPRDTGVPHMSTFFSALGFCSYHAIDISDYGGTIIMDLNQSLTNTYHFAEQYEFVTNIGVSEHLMNQAQFFENAHTVTTVGGYMLHILPAIGYANHGFFNYQPRLFLDLAAANGYSIDRLVFIDREHAVLDLLKPSYFATYFYFMVGLLGASVHGNLLIAALLKKTSDAPFVLPLQGKYVRDIGESELKHQYQGSEGQDPQSVPTKGYFAPQRLSGAGAFVLRVQHKLLGILQGVLRGILGARSHLQ